MATPTATAVSTLGSEVQGFFRRFGIAGQVGAVLMILFGLLIIVYPLLVAWLIGLYLLVGGVVQLAGYLRRPTR